MRTKLLNRFKAASTDSEPHIRLIATQTSMNTLLSEPIHVNAPAALGDVTFRQMEGDENVAVAYAICLHDGEASVYRREMPANMDAKWEYVWKLGAASDVAIEYDGIWEVDASYQWYILRTEQFPYIFFVQNGNLYVQHWRDESTRILLAENVSQLSSCKGWQNSIDRELDQGLIIGYIRSGEVYYRSFCQQEDGSYSWEVERKVTTLGIGNSTLSVIRTNDFRVGFLTQNGNNILLTLTHRNYAGMSVKPETLHTAARARFYFEDLKERRGYQREALRGSCANPFFMLDEMPGSSVISVASAEKINREDSFYCYGCKIYLNMDFSGNIDTAFVAGTTVSYVEGTTTKSATVTDVEINNEERYIALYFSTDIRRVNPITIHTPITRNLRYYRNQQQKWFFPGFTVSLPAETQNIYAYSGRETLTVNETATLLYQETVKKNGYYRETLLVTETADFTLEPTSILPI